MTLLSALTLAATMLASVLAPAPPIAAQVALTRADLPSGVSFLKTFTSYVTPKGLNGDTVPAGLSVKQLRNAGFRGMYTQSLMRKSDNNPYGYPWAYIALPTATSAHRVYAEWVAGIKYPFNIPMGASRTANECRVYQSVISSTIIGLLCRVGAFV